MTNFAVEENDKVAWANYVLASFNLHEQRNLLRSGVEVIVLVDADIVIGDSRRSQRDSLRRDNFFRDFLSAKTAKEYRHAVAEFFSQWIMRKIDCAPVSNNKEIWGMAQDHFGEVVNRTKVLLEEVQQVKSYSQQPEEIDVIDSKLQRLWLMLKQLSENPFSNIDADLIPALELLGNGFVDEGPISEIERMVTWIRSLEEHSLIATRSGGSLNGLEWPAGSDKTFAEQELLWRSVLWTQAGDTRSVTAVGNDARVLAALGVLNSKTSGPRRRVYLMTGSDYLYRAVIGRSLILKDNSGQDNLESDGLFMSDCILLPSSVIGAEDLWEPASFEKDSVIGSIPEWSAFKDAPERRQQRAWFCCAVWNRLDEENKARFKPLNPFEKLPSFGLMRAGPPSGFLDFISSSIAESAALTQLLSRTIAAGKEFAKGAYEKLDGIKTPKELSDFLARLNDLRCVRLCIDTLENFIKAHHLQADGNFQQTVNSLRHPPYVHFWNYPEARLLSELLAESVQPDQVSDLKQRLFVQDKSTYLLVLSYAAAYAAQSRWEFAANAASYAQSISRSKHYESVRNTLMGGEEAIILEFFCLRRSADTLNKNISLRDRLEAFLKSIETRDDLELFFRFRLSVEKNSIEVENFFLRFFGSKVNNVLDRDSFRLEARKKLDEIRGLYKNALDVFAQSSHPKDALVLKGPILYRLEMAALNLAWMTVALPPNLSEKKRPYVPLKDVFYKDNSFENIDFVQRLLPVVTEKFGVVNSSWISNASHGRLSLLSFSIIVDPSVLNLAALPEDIFVKWRDLTINHPYDKKWIRHIEILHSHLGP